MKPLSLWQAYLIVFGFLYVVVCLQTAWNAWISTRPDTPYEVRRSWRALVDSVSGPAWWAPLVIILLSPVFPVMMAVRKARAWMRYRDSCSKLGETPPVNEGDLMSKDAKDKPDTPYCGSVNQRSGTSCSENEGHDRSTLAKGDTTPHSAPASASRESALVWTDPNTEPQWQSKRP